MKKRWVYLILVLAVVGIVLTSISISEFFKIQRVGLESASFCTVNERINCDIINASSYAILLGVPMAVWGLLFYLTTFLFSIYIKFSRNIRDAVVSFIWVLVVFGFLWNLRMAYVSLYILGAICITCFAQYIISFLLAVMFTFAWRKPIRERLSMVFSKKTVASLLTTAIIFGIGYVFALSAMRGAGTDVLLEDVKAVTDAYFRQSLYDIKPQDLDKVAVWGNPSAKVTVMEFSDFQCPFCRIAAFNIRPYLQEFRDEVKFVFINYPLDNSCNKYLEAPMHANACLAARGGVCAQKENKFWGYHDEVFKNQQKISKETLVDLAVKQGIDKGKFEECLDSQESLERVKSDIELGHHVYISGTPSVVVNQRILRAWRSPEVLRAVIREEIKRAKAK